MWRIITLEVDYLKKNVGESIKFIREGKNYTQSYTAGGLLSRTTLSKIENGKINPSFRKTQEIIDKLDISMMEFEYILNNFTRTGKQKIVQAYSELKYSWEQDKIKALAKECSLYLEENGSDHSVERIMLICLGIIDIQNKEILAATQKLEGIWYQLVNQETWFLLDIRMINHIFFLIPIDIADYITKKACKELQKYKKFDLSYCRLHVAFLLNLIELNTLNGLFSKEILKISEECIGICQENKIYDLLALAFIRKGAILNKLQALDWQVFIFKGLSILRACDETGVIDQVFIDLKNLNIQTDQFYFNEEN